MIRRPPRSTRTDTRFPYTTLFRSDYQFTPDVLAYVSYSTGYKSGGVNQAINPIVTNAVYDPEYVKAIEVGVKSQLFDRRLQVNTSLYRNKYDNLQFQIFGPFGPLAFNADGATVQGIELEIRAAPTDWLQFDASGDRKSKRLNSSQ